MGECVGSELLGHIKVPITVNSAEFSIYCETQSLNFAMNAISDQRNVRQHILYKGHLSLFSGRTIHVRSICYQLYIVNYRLFPGNYAVHTYIYVYYFMSL